jgi:arabinose-5-phosphate isomerase
MSSAHRTSALRTLSLETEALNLLAKQLDQQFDDSCDAILACRGRVIVTGLGKSGHICKKIAATLASTGTPAYFVHPSEAAHGDLGMILPQDIVIAISFSGEANELLEVVPALRAQNNTLIAITGNPHSSLAKFAQHCLFIGAAEEACPLGLAPTSSTTATLALGDALAVALLESRGFTKYQFARSHPAGRLGKRLTNRVLDIMRSTAPQIDIHASIQDALVTMSRGRMGCVFTHCDNQLRGIFTDGDLRRLLLTTTSLDTISVGEAHSQNPQTTSTTTLAAAALEQMQSRKISVLAVIEDGVQVGAISLQDCLEAGL